MIKRMRVEPISTYLERYRKGGVAHPSPSRTASSICPAYRRLIQKAARSSRNHLSGNASWCWSSSSIAWRPPARRCRR